MSNRLLTPDALSADRFSAFMEYVKPKPQELRWTEIRWRTDLRAARVEAARQNKPIFLWAMNGDPLGCV